MGINRLRIIALGALLLGLAWSPVAFGQCTGQAQPGQTCGNPGATRAPPSLTGLSGLLDRNFGAPSAQGTMLNRGVGAWVATVAPTLGNPGFTSGVLNLASNAGGTVTIASAPIVAPVNFTLPNSNGTAGQALTTDGAGNTTWTPVTGTGTVQSVGLSLPVSVFSVSGSPVTTVGTLAGTFVNQSANTAFMGPTSGGAATPAFRLLVGADLPAPGLATLGGIQAVNAVSHQWINSITTGGVPQLSQPAFSDISGTLAASQCPLPSASTIGCVQSYAAVSHQWINTISNSGVPASTQPGFSDLSGTLATAQLPTISSPTVLANISGLTAPASANTLTAIIDASVTSPAQGDILYRNATGWVVLAPDTLGKVLTTAGAGANPSWTAVAGTGTVTQINAGTGITLTPSPITTTGSVALANIATGNVLAYTGGGSGTPVATTPTTILDVIGSTQGNILYRAAGNWTVLAPGSSGTFLQLSGTTPQWASPTTTTLNALSGALTIGPVVSSVGTAITLPVPRPKGRLTLQTGVPVMTSSQTTQGTLYYDCYQGGNVVPIYNGSVDTVLAVGSCEISTAMQTSGTGVLNANGVFDAWAVSAAGTLSICVATNGTGGGWASDTGGSNTARGTGYSQLDTTTRPFITNKNAITHCYTGTTDRGSISANQATYLGTILTDAAAAGKVSFTYGASASGGTAARFGVWNAYNRVVVATRVVDTGTTYTYTSATIRQARASAGNQITFVYGQAEDGVTATYAAAWQPVAASTAFVQFGIGLDATNIVSAASYLEQPGTTGTPAKFGQVAATFAAGVDIGVGLHFFSANEGSDGTNANTLDRNSNATLGGSFRL